MITKNCDKAIVQCKNILTSWKKRNLTQVDKITVIKTFIISKLTPLFICLPTPRLSILKEINDLLYKYLWSNKPDKISVLK